MTLSVEIKHAIHERLTRLQKGIQGSCDRAIRVSDMTVPGG